MWRSHAHEPCQCGCTSTFWIIWSTHETGKIVRQAPRHIRDLADKCLYKFQHYRHDSLVLGIVLLIFYFRAMTITFRYHAFIQHAHRFPPAPKKRISDDP